MIEVIEAWLRLPAGRIHDAAPRLTALDQAIGDGDHGTNLDRGFAAVVASLEAGRPDGDDERAVAAALLRGAGRTLISTVGGAAGPLYGTALIRAGAAVAAAEDGAMPESTAVAALEAGIIGIQSLGKATAGEKTMLDALVPAAQAGRAVADDGATGGAIVTAMAQAAEAGAVSTVPMLATKGRASYLGERSIGHQDPGATSAALLLRALADAVAAG